MEEIEHADTNLIRFNLRKNTSEFVEKLCKLDVTATSHDDANHHANHSNHHHHDAHVAAVGKTASDEKVTVRTSSHHHHHPEAYRDCCTVLVSFNNSNNTIFTKVTYTIIMCVEIICAVKVAAGMLRRIEQEAADGHLRDHFRDLAAGSGRHLVRSRFRSTERLNGTERYGVK